MTIRPLVLVLAAMTTGFLPNADAQWRSTLYPDNWKPGTADAAGHFLHDFSYAGYHSGERPLPTINGPVIDVTAAPFGADKTGAQDATKAIQAALDEGARRGGGVVFLPAGKYRLSVPADSPAGLKIEADKVVLRGAGRDKTFLFNETTAMRDKTLLFVKSKDTAWWLADPKPGNSRAVTADLPGGSLRVPLEDAAFFAPGDLVSVRCDLTDRFVAEYGMTGKWIPAQMKNRALLFCRRVVSVDAAGKSITLDVPTRYLLRKDDNACVVKIGSRMQSEVGLEDFSIGNKDNPTPGEERGEEEYTKPGTMGYEVHQSHLIILDGVENGWIRRVNSYCPAGNTRGIHVLSNGLKLERSRFVTVEDCDWRNTGYKGGGGNGYLFTLHGEDCLVRDCHADNGRHNYDLATFYCNGNVITRCTTKNGRHASDFHMYLSVANLFDCMTCDGDFLEAVYRPFGGAGAMHGVTTAQSVFWNTNGLNYSGESHDKKTLVESKQWNNSGYVIGTRGPAARVDSTDFVEGEGKGDTLQPPSLYADQLARRLGHRP